MIPIYMKKQLQNLLERTDVVLRGIPVIIGGVLHISTKKGLRLLESKDLCGRVPVQPYLKKVEIPHIQQDLK